MVDKKLYTKPENLEEKTKDWANHCFSEAGLSILQSRYLMKDEAGKVIETPKEMIYRVANVISEIDSKYKDFDSTQTEKEFYELMALGKFFPNSPTLRGAGLDINLSACYVVPIEDSREGIFKEALFNAVEIQAYGGGTGFNLSNLRAKGSLIHSTKGKASGPISFMEVFDKTIGKTIAQGGTRQGANMGILRVNHPDIEQFIYCKEKDGEITNFNISVGVTEEFMRKAIAEEDYDIIDHKGRVVGQKNAKEIFDKIVANAWKTGDPGIIYLDRINKGNPTPALGEITGTNPCGEQPLLDLEACNLGSINVRYFVKDKKIDWKELEKTVYSSIHFLDNVIDANKFPLGKSAKEKKELEAILTSYNISSKLIPQILDNFSASPIEKMVQGNRKIGLGIMGFADLLASINVGYGSDESYAIAEELMEFIHKKSQEASVKLAETRGVFPNWKNSIYDSESKNFLGEPLKLRNASLNTIAPTGTLSTLLGVAGGIEPQFAVVYTRSSIYDENGIPHLENVMIDKEFERIAKEEGFYSTDLLEEIRKNNGSLNGLRKPKGVTSRRWAELREIFMTANDLDYTEHIRMQDAFQKHVDNAISKTINLPNDATIDEVRGAYLMTYETCVKGITTYRDDCKKGQTLSAKIKEELKSGERPKVLGTTIKQRSPFGSAFISLNDLKDDMTIPYESFVEIGKGGKDIGAVAEGYGRLLSLVFKLGGTIDEVTEQLIGISAETKEGIGQDIVQSLPDAIGKGLREAYSQLTNTNGHANNHNNKSFSGNFCPSCGSKLMMVEGCQKCTCGFSKC